MKLIGQYSILGTGLSIYALERCENGLVRFSLWISVLFLPLIPISTWTGKYIAPGKCHMLFDEQYFFCNLTRVGHDYGGYLKTFSAGISAYAIAILPTAIMIIITEKRGGTKVELVFVFAFALWPLIMLNHLLEKRRSILRGDSFGIRDWVFNPIGTLRRILGPDGLWVTGKAISGEPFPLPKGVVLRPLADVVLAFPSAVFGPEDTIASIVNCDDEATISLPDNDDKFYIRLKAGMLIAMSKSCEGMVVSFDDKGDEALPCDLYIPAGLRRGVRLE